MAKRVRRATSFLCTDSGNGQLLALRYKDTLRFDHKREAWLIWRDHWWAADGDGEVIRLAQQAARERLKASALIGDDAERNAQASWALQSESRHRIYAALELAKATRPLADDGTRWNCDPMLLGVANGVVDLRSGKLRAGRPADRVTLHTDVPFEPAARCPRFNQFIAEVFNHSDELAEFIHRAVGYCLTGDVTEQCFFLCHGDGANGKTTFLETLRHVLGGYACNLPFSAFEILGRSAIPNDVATLPSKRFVTAAETTESARLNEARVKALTGGDRTTARPLYRNLFEFDPTAKFWLAVNHRPRISDSSEGIWRRVRLIPFEVQFRGDHADKELLSKLKAEAPGILAWAVRGCLSWQAKGLGSAPQVERATAAYRDENDVVGLFLADVCSLEAGAITLAAALWESFNAWCREQHVRAIDRKAFSHSLQGRGLEKVRVGRDRAWAWKGVRIVGGVTGFSAQSEGADVRTDADVSQSKSLM